MSEKFFFSPVNKIIHQWFITYKPRVQQWMNVYVKDAHLRCRLFHDNFFCFLNFPWHVFDCSYRFNVAEIGAMSRDIPHEAKVLVKRITYDPNVNVTRDWKMITILIGPNDFCLDFCYQQNPEKSIKNHRQELIETLRTLRDNLPRTIVNVVTPPCKQLININRITTVCLNLTFLSFRSDESYLLFTRQASRMHNYASRRMSVRVWFQVWVSASTLFPHNGTMATGWRTGSRNGWIQSRRFHCCQSAIFKIGSISNETKRKPWLHLHVDRLFPFEPEGLRTCQ